MLVNTSQKKFRYQQKKGFFFNTLFQQMSEQLLTRTVLQEQSAGLISSLTSQSKPPIEVINAFRQYTINQIFTLWQYIGMHLHDISFFLKIYEDIMKIRK